MTLRLTEDEQNALRERAAFEGTSMQEVARRAVREYIAKADHRDRVAAAAEFITQRYAVALHRLGERAPASKTLPRYPSSGMSKPPGS